FIESAERDQAARSRGGTTGDHVNVVRPTSLSSGSLKTIEALVEAALRNCPYGTREAGVCHCKYQAMLKGIALQVVERRQGIVILPCDRAREGIRMSQRVA